MAEPTEAERAEHLEKTARTRELWYLEAVPRKRSRSGPSKGKA